MSKHLCFFADRDNLIDLGENETNVLSVLETWGIGRIDEKNTVHFCGLLVDANNGAFCFLPRESKSKEFEQNVKVAKLTMKALVRFALETSNNDSIEDGLKGNGGLFAIIKKLDTDFRQYGLYFERDKQLVINSGKPDWDIPQRKNMRLKIVKEWLSLKGFGGKSLIGRRKLNWQQFKQRF